MSCRDCHSADDVFEARLAQNTGDTKDSMLYNGEKMLEKQSGWS